MNKLIFASTVFLLISGVPEFSKAEIDTDSDQEHSSETDPETNNDNDSANGVGFEKTYIEELTLSSNLSLGSGRVAGIGQDNEVTHSIIEKYSGSYSEKSGDSGRSQGECEYHFRLSDLNVETARAVFGVPFINISGTRSRTTSNDLFVPQNGAAPVKFEFATEDGDKGAEIACKTAEKVVTDKKRFITEIYSRYKVFNCESNRDCGLQHLSKSDQLIYSRVQENDNKNTVSQPNWDIKCLPIVEDSSKKACKLVSTENAQCSKESVDTELQDALTPITVESSFSNKFPGCASNLKCSSVGFHKVNERTGIMGFLGNKSTVEREVFKCKPTQFRSIRF